MYLLPEGRRKVVNGLEGPHCVRMKTSFQRKGWAGKLLRSLTDLGSNFGSTVHSLAFSRFYFRVCFFICKTGSQYLYSFNK